MQHENKIDYDGFILKTSLIQSLKEKVRDLNNEEEIFFLKDHQRKIKKLKQVLCKTRTIPSPYSTLKRVYEKEFVIFLEQLLNCNVSNIGNRFFNIWLRKMHLVNEGQVEIIETKKEIESLNRIDLLVNCKGKPFYAFEVKLDNYNESENQTNKHVESISKAYPAPDHEGTYIFLDSKGKKAQNKKFINKDLMPLIEALIELENEVGDSEDKFYIKSFKEIVDELSKRAK